MRVSIITGTIGEIGCIKRDRVIGHKGLNAVAAIVPYNRSIADKVNILRLIMDTVAIEIKNVSPRELDRPVDVGRD